MSSRKGRTTGKQAAKKAAKKGSAKKGAAGKGTAKKASKAKAGTTKKRAAGKSAAKKRAAKKAAPKPFVPVLTGPEKLAIVERYIAAYNGRDTATILSLYAPKATMEDPLGLPPAVGHKAIAGLYQMGFDMNVTIAHDGAVRCAGNSVAFPLIASSPSSKLDVIDVFDFGRDGKIVSMRAYWGPDNLEGDLAVRQS